MKLSVSERFPTKIQPPMQGNRDNSIYSFKSAKIVQFGVPTMEEIVADLNIFFSYLKKPFQCLLPVIKPTIFRIETHLVLFQALP